MKMQTKKIRKLALAGMALIAGTVQGAEYRGRAEFNGTADNNYTLRTTVGSTFDSYNSVPISTKGQFLENFRLYDVIENMGGEVTHYDAFGIRTPTLQIGKLENRVVLFGASGDKQGAGIETTHLYDKKLKLRLNAEQNSLNDTRLGFGLSTQLTSNFNLGIGYDRVSTETGNIDQYLVNGVLDLSKTDSVGLAVVKRDNIDKTTTYSVGSFWTHYGKDEKWGTRLFGRYDWNPDKDFRSLSGELIWAQNPTTFKPGSTWFVERDVDTDGGYNLSVVPLSVSRTEGVILSDRARYGFSAVVSGAISEEKDSKWGNVGAGIGYTFAKPVLGGQFGISAGARYEFSNTGDESYIVEPKVVWRNKNLEVDVGMSKNISHDNDTMFRAGMQVRW